MRQELIYGLVALAYISTHYQRSNSDPQKHKTILEEIIKLQDQFPELKKDFDWKIKLWGDDRGDVRWEFEDKTQEVKDKIAQKKKELGDLFE